jgi:hypothetical protein
VRHVRQQEIMVKRLNRCSEISKKLIEKQVIVFDLKDLSYALDTTALNTFKRTLSVDEACYPERLKYLLMINTPFFFTAIWAMIKPWINQDTASKIRMWTASEYEVKLKELIDEQHIPVEYGGSWKEFGWKYPENLDLSEVYHDNNDWMAYCI